VLIYRVTTVLVPSCSARVRGVHFVGQWVERSHVDDYVVVVQLCLLLICSWYGAVFAAVSLLRTMMTSGESKADLNSATSHLSAVCLRH